MCSRRGGWAQGRFPGVASGSDPGGCSAVRQRVWGLGKGAARTHLNLAVSFKLSLPAWMFLFLKGNTGESAVVFLLAHVLVARSSLLYSGFCLIKTWGYFE